jgi:hypothetical protein
MNRDMLAALDPAPKRELTPAEQFRQEQLLSSILADTVTIRRSRPMRRVAIAGALAAGMAAAVVVAPVAYHMIRGNPGLLSAAAIGSWTGTPVRLAAATTDSTAQQFCEQHATGDPKATGPFTISNADLRGQVTSMVLTRGNDITLCLVGSDGAGLTEAIEPVEKIAANTINIYTAGSHGEVSTGFSYAAGSAGSNVKAIVLHDGNRTVEALVDGGRWTAWWPTGEHLGGTPDTVTITLQDGTSHSVPGGSLFR